MKIYTGYYGRMKMYRGMTCIGISLGTPRWLAMSIKKCSALYPKQWMLKLEDREQYICEYRKLLNELDAGSVLENLKTMSEGCDVILLCYEKPSDFCHRHLVAEWLEKASKESVEEAYEEMYVRKDGMLLPAQGELF